MPAFTARARRSIQRAADRGRVTLGVLADEEAGAKVEKATPPGGLSEIDLATLISGENGAFIESLFEDWAAGRAVPESWRGLFDGLVGGNGARGNGALAAPGPTPPPAISPVHTPSPSMSGVGLFGLVDAYRALGHLVARLDPLGRGEEDHPLLDPARFGFAEADLDLPGGAGHFRGLERGTPRELISALRETYCGTFAVEFMEMRDKERRDWLIEQMEPRRNRPEFSPDEKVRILGQLMSAERFEQFIHRRFVGQKRFSVEGGEALIPLLDTLVEDGAALGAEEMVIGMAHRGRLNVLAHLMDMPYRAIFAEFQQGLVPRDAQGSGDVRYHRGYSTDRMARSGSQIHLSLQPNPSHLEAINPVVEGIVRAKQNIRGDTERNQVLPLLIHGDAAFMGQGIVAETLSMSELDSYWTGGTIHVIVNNQIGFTTDPEDYCFTQHPTDMAKVIQAPVFHVNADDPEACVHAAKLAISFRQRFQEDVIIDLVCYRRYGHNEGEDPTLTQPLLYQQIAKHERIGSAYTRRLLEDDPSRDVIVARLEEERRQRLEEDFEASKRHLRLEGAEGYHGLWSGRGSGKEQAATPVKTGVPLETLLEIGRALTDWPSDFHVHKKLERLMRQRRTAIEAGGPLDWGTAEALAIGAMLREGSTVRLTGQDVEPGTFGHRHAVLHDVENRGEFVPLRRCARDGAQFIIANSLLSEAAVLGFEYGYSTVDPSRLVIWEAQFGDFSNSAQVIIDQFISSSEQKWNRSAGIVMLLPHGYEGQGPEHSSARLERFLQLCAEDNLQVCNLSTPAQLFHALRRQLARNFRKPLVIMSPKSLLRHPMAASAIAEFTSGSLLEVIDDASFGPRGRDPQTARRVLICSGKVYYTLQAAREDTAFDDVALVRLEQLHPFPFEVLREVLARYGTRDIMWVQEEPWNMGGWSYIQDRLRRVLPKGARLRYVGRSEAASPAAGSYRQHEEEESEFVREAFAKRPRRPPRN